jgi:hypothetical protein
LVKGNEEAFKDTNPEWMSYTKAMWRRKYAILQKKLTCKLHEKTTILMPATLYMDLSQTRNNQERT